MQRKRGREKRRIKKKSYAHRDKPKVHPRSKGHIFLYRDMIYHGLLFFSLWNIISRWKIKMTLGRRMPEVELFEISYAKIFSNFLPNYLIHSSFLAFDLGERGWNQMIKGVRGVYKPVSRGFLCPHPLYQYSIFNKENIPLRPWRIKGVIFWPFRLHYDMDQTSTTTTWLQIPPQHAYYRLRPGRRMPK